MKVDNVVKALGRFGIQTAAYKRAPVGQDVFAISIQPRSPEGVVTINHGNAEVEVFGSKRLKQAAISVFEKRRKVTREVSEEYAWNPGATQPTVELQQRILRGKFPVIMPRDTKWTFKDMTCEKKSRKLQPGYSGGPSRTHTFWLFKGTVTATVGRSTRNNFLVGMDETHHFISPLPKKATSVKQAHKDLRPEVKRGSKRQGEWFFEPVSERKLITILNDHADSKLFRRQGRFRLGNTTHIAMTHINLVHRRKGDKRKAKHLYVRGDIIDGRRGHHAVLFLDRWHRVVRNKEGKMKVDAGQREMAQRRSVTWD
jgi:hypothetical protein